MGVAHRYVVIAFQAKKGFRITEGRWPTASMIAPAVVDEHP
jgi:hypothetical protein